LEVSSISPYMFKAIVTGGILIAAYLVERLVLRTFIGRFAASIELDPHYANIIKKFGALLVYLAASFVVLANLGISGLLYGLLASAGFAGIVVGMAAREVFADIISGLILMIERPFKVGDPVVIGGESGMVEAIGFRSVTVRAWSGEKLVIPNSKVSDSTIKNFNIKARRADISLLVDYQADIGKAIKVCEELLRGHPEILEEPKPTLLVGDFKDLGIELKLLFWLPTPKFFPILTEIRQRILESFSKEGIKIALPRIRVIDHSR